MRKNIVYLTSRQNKPKENEVKEENDFSKRIMETTIIKIGTECLTLKELGNKIKSTETPKNSDLSIVKNFFNKTNSFSNTKSLKFKDKENKIFN